MVVPVINRMRTVSPGFAHDESHSSASVHTVKWLRFGMAFEWIIAKSRVV